MGGPAGSARWHGSRHDGPVTSFPGDAAGPPAAGSAAGAQGEPPADGQRGRPAAGPQRLAELRANLADVRARIAAAARAAGRDPGEITLIAITKTFPVSDIAALSEIGVTEVGENRDAEAAPKAARCAALGLLLTWHFVGQLQTNKCASVVRYADVVHSVDRPRLVRVLGARATAAGRTITCLVQVSLDGHPDRGGALPDQAPGLADAVAGQDGLILGGVMAVAPLPEPAGSPAAGAVSAAAAFARLREVAGIIRAAHPRALMISAGMSGDLEDAIAHGATHVRVGTALLGGRRPLVR
jgi:PLP dependent protein